MPDNKLLDWPTWLASINLFQVAVVIIALWLIVRLLVKFWPWLRKVMALTSALAQLPDFIERTDKRIAEIHHEVHYNNGSSVKDAVERVELGVKGLYERMDDAEAADAQLRQELEDTRPRPALPEKPEGEQKK